MKIKIVFFGLVISTASLFSQIPRGGIPMLTKSFRSAAPAYELNTSFIKDAILKIADDEDAIYGKKPLKIAVDQQVKLNPGNSGKWITLQNGYRVWRIEIHSENAAGMALFFDRFQVNEDVMIFLYDPNFEFVIGGFNHLNNKKTATLQTEFIPGERIILELQVPEGMLFGELSIGSVSHAFVDIFTNEKDGYYGTSGNCEIDINCPEGAAWQVLKRSVARVIFKRDGFITEICTGALINNTSENGMPYFYTANHCIRRAFEAETAVFYFGYESPECEGTDGVIGMSLSGSEILATSDSLDFTLLLLSDDPPESYKPYFAGWSALTNPPNSSVTIHHPRGDVKKISRDLDRALTEYQEDDPPSWLYTGSTPGAFWRIESWESGATEAGSSGCPLFNEAKLIAGNLTGGDASCLYPYNDYFSKFFMNWDYYPEPERQLKYWLDSLRTGNLFIEGYDPYDLPDPFKIDRFQVYPNPSKGTVTIYTDTLDLYDASIRIYNFNGVQVANYRIETVESTTFDLSGLENGFYVIEIKIQGYLERKKIVLVK
ncbi:MAG: T9SS type A sorting domain-containing protein [Bacteroidales bacterium]